jgi:four helix bundle protein
LVVNIKRNFFLFPFYFFLEMQSIPDRTFQFAVRIVKLCQHLEESGGVSRTIGKQLLRSGTSIGANVQEGQAGQSKADFISKNYIALKEARETLLLAKTPSRH